MTNSDGPTTDGPTTDSSPRPPVPLDPETQKRLDRELQRKNELDIAALLHDAWIRQIQHRRGILFRITATDIHVLELMCQALQQIPATESPT